MRGRANGRRDKEGTRGGKIRTRGEGRRGRGTTLEAVKTVGRKVSKVGFSEDVFFMLIYSSMEVCNFVM